MKHLATIPHATGQVDLYRATSAADAPDFLALDGAVVRQQGRRRHSRRGRLPDHPDLVWTLAVRDGRAISFGAVDLSHLAKGDALLNYAYVDESVRSNGIYRHILEARVDFVRTETTARRLIALCTADSAPTLTKLGFTETSKRGRYTRFVLEIPR
ncbi:MAG: GNAT family N-acetyltransferase [Chromatiales bacterium]|nr:GNAT family N-acetyltransferase [Chromatiales bacterium]